jgi:multimeric flavodoxin WrbA
MSPQPLRYLALNCTLKKSPAPSSTDVLLRFLTGLLHEHHVTGRTIRVVDHDVRFGVSDDEGDGDGWPSIRAAILDADILLFATPIWLGHPASVAQVVLERLDAMLSDVDEREQVRLVDRVAILGVVGNEDGAHHVGAEVFQGLNDVGFTLPPAAMTYWVGEAMQRVDLKDLDEIPEKTADTGRTMVANAVHLAHWLRSEGRYPALSSAGSQGSAA